MPYYTEVLQQGEKVLYNQKLHWIIYVHTFVISALIVTFLLTEASSGYERGFSISFLLVAFAISLCPLAVTWVKRQTTEIVVTDKRIILKIGIIFRKTMEMNMSKVETVDVNQSILGRFLNYGTVLIRGSGSTYEPLQNIAHPLDLRNAIIVR